MGSKHKFRPQEAGGGGGQKSNVRFFLGGWVMVCSKKHTSEYVFFTRLVSVKKCHYFIFVR